MAAILQLRQGSTSTYISQGPNIAEPFFDTGSNILVVGKSATEVIKLTKLDESNDGSFSITGDITASNAILSGDITISGNIILGDDVTDDITISGQLDSNLIPKTDATYDLGSTTKKWNNLHVVSGSIDSIDLTQNLPSGIVSSSNQIDTGSTHFQEGVQLYSINGVTPLSGLYGSATGLGVQIRGLSADGLSFDGPGNLIIDTGSNYFISGAQEASLLGLPEGTVSSSQQVIDFLPTNVVSGSDQVLGGTDIVSSSIQVTNFLPSGVISGSTQVLDGTNIVSSSQQVMDFLPTNVISGSGQVVDFLPTGVLSGSEQLPSGTVSGSAQTLDHLEASTLVAINQTSPSSIGAAGELIINGSTNGYSGVLTLQSGSVDILYQYATESDKMINLLGGAGYGLFLQPDNTTSKAWVIDTDGDFVSQGTGDVYAENVYSTLAISGSSLSLANNATIGGTISAGGDIIAYASSDRRLKDEITPIKNPLEKINSIGGYSFLWNTSKQDIYKGKDYGVIAQEIEEILPELVNTRENGYKSVKYDKIISLLIEGIKELSHEVNILKEINRE